MNKIVGIGAVILVLAGVAYFITQNQQVPVAQNNTDTQSVAASQQSQRDLEGTWQSKEDAKFTREFSANGTVVDRYEGDASATMTGTYETVDASAVAEVPATSLAGLMIVKVVWRDDPTPMLFSINALTDADLVMTNLSGRGNLLSFTKVR